MKALFILDNRWMRLDCLWLEQLSGIQPNPIARIIWRNPRHAQDYFKVIIGTRWDSPRFIYLFNRREQDRTFVWQMVEMTWSIKFLWKKILVLHILWLSISKKLTKFQFSLSVFVSSCSGLPPHWVVQPDTVFNQWCIICRYLTTNDLVYDRMK